MAFSTKISFVPRDNGEKSVSFDGVDYGFQRPYYISDLLETEYAFLDFKKIISDGYIEFVTILKFEEFKEFHNKYLNKKYHDKEAIEFF